MTHIDPITALIRHHAENAPVVREMWEVPADSYPVMIQNVQPGMEVFVDGSYYRVTEYPITTGQGVYVNMSGAQIGPHPLDSEVCVRDTSND